MMFSGLVGFTANAVSLCGAVPSQSVFTFELPEVAVLQIGLDGFLKFASLMLASADCISGDATLTFRCAPGAGEFWASALEAKRSKLATIVRVRVAIASSVYSRCRRTDASTG